MSFSHRLLVVLAVCLLPNLPAIAASPSESCAAPGDLTRLSGRLMRTGLRIERREKLTIVAIGSSSTEGVGASTPEASYPSQLAAELQRRLPGEAITVLNKGVGGETSVDMMARFDRDVFAARPDLVIWQVGTNSVLRDEDIVRHQEIVRGGIMRLKESGIDVVIMDAQYAPEFLAHPGYRSMERALSSLGKEEGVPVFHRFALMHHWVKAGQLDFATMLAPDGLHLNDLSYECVGRMLADSVLDAARSSTMTSRR
jgi:acyl-CoA thioesterase I